MNFFFRSFHRGQHREPVAVEIILRRRRGGIATIGMHPGRCTGRGGWKIGFPGRGRRRWYERPQGAARGIVRSGVHRLQGPAGSERIVEGLRGRRDRRHPKGEFSVVHLRRGRRGIRLFVRGAGIGSVNPIEARERSRGILPGTEEGRA